MSMLVFLAFYLIVIISGRPNAKIDSRSVVTVPPNCPDGQEYINGDCRDVWIRKSNMDIKYAQPKNYWFQMLFDTLRSTRRITRSPDEAKAGIWSRSIMDIPKQCPQGKSADALGYCRTVGYYD